MIQCFQDTLVTMEQALLLEGCFLATYDSGCPPVYK